MKKLIQKMAIVSWLSLVLFYLVPLTTRAQLRDCKLPIETILVDSSTGQPMRNSLVQAFAIVSLNAQSTGFGSVWTEEILTRTDSLGRIKFVLGTRNFDSPSDNFCVVLANVQPLYVYLTTNPNRAILYKAQIGEAPYAMSAVMVPDAEDFPVGSILAYGADGAAPDSYLRCTSSQVVDKDQTPLGRVLNGNWGQSTSMSGVSANLPNLEGLFMRGVSGTSGRDPDVSARGNILPGGLNGNNVGSFQLFEIGDHKHDFDIFRKITPNISFSSSISRRIVDVSGPNARLNTRSTGASETRPKNAAVNFIIKTQP